MKESGKIVASIEVKNTGACYGGEIAQLYIGDDESSVVRPVRELKGFKKVFLEPGKRAVLEFEIDRSSLAYFDEEKHDWVAEKGVFTAYVGSSSRNLHSKAQFELK
jgi:beta-glucosidase